MLLAIKAGLTLLLEKKVQITPEYFEASRTQTLLAPAYGVATNVFVDGKRVLADEVVVQRGKVMPLREMYRYSFTVLSNTQVARICIEPSSRYQVFVVSQRLNGCKR